MHYCLTCRHYSGDGPICTHCGRSFGGRLCNGKKRHLNPPDAQFCGRCGIENLTDAASGISLNGLLFLLFAAVGMALFWLVGSHVLDWGQQGFKAATGFRSPLVWLAEKGARAVLFLAVVYFLSAFIPGRAGEQFRALLSRSCLEVFRLASLCLGSLVKLLLAWLSSRNRAEK